MGEVYRARDLRLQRDVAFKILPPLFVSDPERLARFEREARLLASLNHPHIAAIYGIEESGAGAQRMPVLVLELVDGETIEDRLGKRSDSAGRSDRDRVAGCGSSGGGARPRNRSPRSQTGEHQDRARRQGEGPGFRSRQSARPRRFVLIFRSDAFPDADIGTGDSHGSRHGHGGVHGARAGAREASRSPGGHLGLRRAAVRDARRRPALPR